jgi:hypothetical protein
MNSRVALWSSLVVAVIAIAAPAAAQNMLTNNSFPANVAGWALDGSASVAWNSLDADGSPASGSALVTNSSPGASNGAGMYQCAGAVIAGNSYDYGGRILIPSGQLTTGDAQVGLRFLDGAGCTGNTVGSQPRIQVGTTGSWQTATSTGNVAPAGAVSVLFLAFPSKVEAGGTLQAHFDNLYVGPPGTTPVELAGVVVE